MKQLTDTELGTPMLYLGKRLTLKRGKTGEREHFLCDQVIFERFENGETEIAFIEWVERDENGSPTLGDAYDIVGDGHTIQDGDEVWLHDA